MAPGCTAVRKKAAVGSPLPSPLPALAGRGDRKATHQPGPRRNQNHAAARPTPARPANWPPILSVWGLGGTGSPTVRSPLPAKAGRGLEGEGHTLTARVLDGGVDDPRAQLQGNRAENRGMDVSLVRRRALRRASTDAEAALWSRLRASRLAGFKFRRQHPCGPYILDFYCPGRHLAVELDGGQHFHPTALEYDARRTAFLVRRGIAVVRFPTDLVFREPIAVLDAILLALLGVPSP